MDTLSRREEESLSKTTKARALKECSELVKSFAECASGRTISIVWACRPQHKDLQNCMLQFTNPTNMDILRAEYIKLRNERRQEGL